MPVAACSAYDRPRPLDKADVFHIGRQVTHVSHVLYMYRGLIYCSKCGARAGASRLRKLAKVCEPAVPGSTGRLVLDRINAGIKPPGIVKWPDEL